MIRKLSSGPAITVDSEGQRTTLCFVVNVEIKKEIMDTFLKTSMKLTDAADLSYDYVSDVAALSERVTSG